MSDSTLAVCIAVCALLMAVMGIYTSFKKPTAERRKWWLIAFLLLGGISIWLVWKQAIRAEEQEEKNEAVQAENRASLKKIESLGEENQKLTIALANRPIEAIVKLSPAPPSTAQAPPKVMSSPTFRIVHRQMAFEGGTYQYRAWLASDRMLVAPIFLIKFDGPIEGNIRNWPSTRLDDSTVKIPMLDVSIGPNTPLGIDYSAKKPTKVKSVTLLEK